METGYLNEEAQRMKPYIYIFFTYIPGEFGMMLL